MRLPFFAEYSIVRFTRATCCALGVLLFASGATGARPRHEPQHEPAAASAQRHPGSANPELEPVRQARAVRIRAILSEAGLGVPNAARHTPSPPTPPPAKKPERANAAGEPDSQTNRGDATPAPADDAAASTDLFVPGPVTDAVARVCGNVTVCGVWWPTALGDRDAYRSCVLHRSTDALDFGTSPQEMCSALYSGDCDAAEGQSDLAELCSLVPGTAARWTADYAFSRMVTSGDCKRYQTVAIEEKRVLGLRLTPPSEGELPPAGGPGDSHLRICTGTLYLRVTR